MEIIIVPTPKRRCKYQIRPCVQHLALTHSRWTIIIPDISCESSACFFRSMPFQVLPSESPCSLHDEMCLSPRHDALFWSHGSIQVLFSFTVYNLPPLLCCQNLPALLSPTQMLPLLLNLWSVTCKNHPLFPDTLVLWAPMLHRIMLPCVLVFFLCSVIMFLTHSANSDEQALYGRSCATYSSV